MKDKRMTVAVVCIGDELLIGQVTDTNSGEIARHIEPSGWRVELVQVTGDSADEIRSAIDRAFAVSDVVLTTGGLGPTKDDITKDVLREYFGGELREDAEVLENVKEIVAKRGLKLNELTARQAIVPTSCTVIQNRVGTAPLMWFEKGGKVLVAMPGVPFETKEMFESEVFPRLLKRFGSEGARVHRTLIVTGISESALATRLEEFEEKLPERYHLAYLPKPGLIRLRLDGVFSSKEDAKREHAETERLVSELKELCGRHFLYDGDKTPAEILLEELKGRKLKVCTAESCTGGNIAAAITAIAGASKVMQGGVVAYSNDVKMNVLGVKAATLKAVGAVSRETVEEMAAGALALTGSDVAIATSGVAGPGGGTPLKPVGTVAIGIATRRGKRSKVYHFPGNRQRIIERSVMTALVNAIRIVRGESY